MSPCKVTFKPSNVLVDVDTDEPINGVGVAGTLLNIALANGVEIDHPCEGEGTCGLCYVVIERGMDNLSPASSEEQGLLDQNAPEPATLRLACQAVVRGDVVCRIPC
jgi:2Fe-2S ferredoxin